MTTIRIIGTGSAVPEKKITNQDLTAYVETSDEWIRERTGIGGRHISTGESLTDLAARASKEAIAEASIDPKEIDLIIAATCSPEDALPCAACQVQAQIGADHAVAFDLNAACSGFLFALNTAYAYMNSGIYKKALIIGAEVLSKMVDWTDRGTCILFGDGAGAVVVEACDSSEGGLIAFTQGANGMKGDVLSCRLRNLENMLIPEKQPLQYIQMDGREVYKFATRQVPDTIKEALAKTEYTPQDIDLYVLHQANARIIEAIAKRLSVEIDKCPMNLEEYGNMSSATIPVLLHELHKEGRIKKGMKLVLSGFGAGLTYGACVMIW